MASHKGSAPDLSADTRRNREYWDRTADTYQREHGEQLRKELVWGTYSIPERTVRALGPYKDRDVLELGCGGGQWSVFLAARGARVVGLDNSARQLTHARRLARGQGVRVRFVHAPAQAVPLPDAAFDLVFCDHGAMSYVDPHESLPEVARLLRPGGRLVFNLMTPFAMVTWNEELQRSDTTLRYDYFGHDRWDDVEGFVAFEYGYGDWIRLLRRHGFVVDDLIELRPPTRATSTYRAPEELDWCRRWPAEHIWVTHLA